MRAALLATAALLVAPLAHAQSASNDQYTLRGSTAVTTVRVGESTEVGATAVAAGNTVATASEGSDAELENNQHMDGAVNATVDVEANHAHGVATATSAAVSNGGTAGALDGDMDIRSTQLSHNDANATARLGTNVAGDVASSASASGNVGAVSSENGDVRLIATQESTGSVTALSEGEHGIVEGQAVSAAIASANNMTAAGSTTTMLTDTTQVATGARVAARSDLYADTAQDASGNATANGNSTVIDNAFGYVNARSRQSSTADVSADSYVTLGSDFTGFASAGAYGVGNSTIVSNVTSDTALDVTQANGGDVSANAALDGGGGDMALVSAAAYGNVVTGALCAYCGDEEPGLTARNDQTNDSDVTATASVLSSRARTVAATSSAIGNAATYQVSGPN